MTGTKHSRPRAAIYTRISNDPKLTQSGVERQYDDCVAFASALDAEVVHHYEDNDVSAYRAGVVRPDFEAMLDAAKRSQFDVIICWHFDRLLRKRQDFERVIEAAQAGGVRLIKGVRSGEVDLSTAAGEMLGSILTTIGHYESQHNSKRRVAANLQKAQRGEWQTANRTFGYTMDGAPLEPEASAVRQAAVDVLAGKSIQGVARQWKAAGLTGTRGRPFNSPSVRRLLVNPRYAGLKTHRGKVIGPGNWTPLIDVDTHKGLTALLSDPKRVKCTSFERKFIGSGLYLCGICDDGTTMKAAYPGGSRAGGRRYVCRKHAHLVRSGEPLDDYVTGWMIEVLSAPKAHLRLDNQNVDLDDVNLKREALARRKEGVRRAHNAGSLNEAEYLADLAELSNQMMECDAKLADATRTSPAASLVAAGELIWDRWQQMTPTERAQAIDEIATVTILPVTHKGRGFNPADVHIEPRR